MDPFGDFTSDPPMFFIYDRFNITFPDKPSFPSTFLPFRFFWQQFSMQGYLLFVTYVLHNSVDTPFRDLIGILILDSFMFCFFFPNTTSRPGLGPNQPAIQRPPVFFP